MTCECIAKPPVFDVGPPPDLSLVWHLLSDEPYEKAPDCEWSPFVSISDISTNSELPLTSQSLIVTALIAVLAFIILLLALIYKLKRRSRARRKTKTDSSDAIMCAGENVWTYNSMKTSHTGSVGVLMYSGNGSHSGSRIFHQTTPATLRSYIGTSLEPVPLRHSASTTLRLQSAENSVSYHSVGRRAAPPTEYYEEIPPRGSSSHIPSTNNVPISSQSRMSIRKPPPTCRPPPPPREYSPGGSDCSIEKELSRIPTDSPPPPRWDESESRSRQSAEGRESGYGTTPSRQWRSPPGSGGRSDDSPRVPTYLLSQTPNAHSMTYV